MTEVDVLIVGAGHAGGMAAITLRQAGFTGSILMLGEEAEPPYERPPLSKAYLKNELETERLFLRKPSYWQEHHIDLMMNSRVARVTPTAQCVDTDDGRVWRYQHLIWATGGRPRPLVCEGAALQGVHYVRSIKNVRALKSELQAKSRLVVIGGGYIGLEVAASARKIGAHVSVVELQPHLLARVTSPPVADFFATKHRAEGVEIYTGTGVTGLAGSDRVEAVMLSSGQIIAADVVVVGIGIIPNVEPLAAAGIACDNGVHVDAQGRTADAHIFAIGDCAQHPNIFANGARIRLESVQNAVDQAKLVAAVCLGKAYDYADVPWFWSDQYDIKLQTAGLCLGYDQIVLRGEPTQAPFSVVYLRDGQMIAIDCLNNIRDFMAAKQLIAKKFRPDIAKLADPAIQLKTLLSD